MRTTTRPKGTPRRGRYISRAILAAGMAVCTGMLGWMPPAQAKEGFDDTGHHVAKEDSIVQAALGRLQTPGIVPEGVNTGCKPKPGENPIVLVHGMTSNSYGSFSALGPALAQDGRCIYAPTFGLYTNNESLAGSLGEVGGLQHVDQSYAEVEDYIAALKEYTGAQKVDLVGYSLGSLIAAMFAKEHGADEVGTVVSLGGVLGGTTLAGLSHAINGSVAAGVPLDTLTERVLGGVGMDLLTGSEVITRLNAGGVEVPGVHYVSISTRLDDAVTPMEHTQFHAPDSTRLIVQDGCAQDLTDHLGLPYSPRVISMVRNVFGANVPLACGPGVLMFPDLSALGANYAQPDGLAPAGPTGQRGVEELGKIGSHLSGD